MCNIGEHTCLLQLHAVLLPSCIHFAHMCTHAHTKHTALQTCMAIAMHILTRQGNNKQYVMECGLLNQNKNMIFHFFFIFSDFLSDFSDFLIFFGFSYFLRIPFGSLSDLFRISFRFFLKKLFFKNRFVQFLFFDFFQIVLDILNSEFTRTVWNL